MYVSAHHHDSCFTSVIVFSSFRCMSVHTITVLVSLVLLCILLSDVCQCTPSRFLFHQCYCVFFFPVCVSAHHHGSCFTSVIVFSSFRCMSVHTITVLVSLVLLCFRLSDVCQCTPSRFLFHQCYCVFFFPMYVSAHHHGSCFTSVIVFSSFRCMSVHTITVLVSLVLLCFLLSDVCQCTPSRFLFHQCYCVFFFPMYVSAHRHGSCFTSVTVFCSFRCMSVHTITVLVSLVLLCFLLSDVCQCTPSRFLFHQCLCVLFFPMYVSAHHHGSCFTSVTVYCSFRCTSVYTITVLISLVLLCFLLSDVCQCTPSRFLFHQCHCVLFFPMYASAHHHGSCFTSVTVYCSFRCTSVYTITVLISLVLLCFLLSDVCQCTPSRFLFHQCHCVLFFPMYVSAHHHGSCFASVIVFSSFRCMSVHTITVLVSLMLLCFLLSDLCQCTPSRFLFHQCHCVLFFPLYVSAHHHCSCFISVIVYCSFRCMSVHTITVLVSLVLLCLFLSDVCQYTPSRFLFHQCYCVFFLPMYVSAPHHGSRFTCVIVFSSFRCMSVHTITVLVSLVLLCILLTDVCQCTPSRFSFHQCYCVFFFPMYVSAHHHGSCFTSVIVFSSFRCMSVHTITVLVSLVLLCFLLSDVCQCTPSRFLFHQCYCVFFCPMYVSAHHHGSCFTSVIVFSSFRCMSVHTITVLVSLVLLCFLLSDVCQCTPSRFWFHQCYCVFFFPMYVSAHHHGSCFTSVIVFSSFRCMSVHTITVLVSLVSLCFLLSDVCQYTPSRFLFHQCYSVFFFPMYVSAHHHGSCFTSVIVFSSFRCMSVHTITVLVSLVSLCFLLSDVCQCTPSRFLFHQCYSVFFFPMYVSAHHHGSCFTSVTVFSSFRCMSVHTITVLVSLVLLCFLLSDVCQCTPSRFLFHQCYCVFFCPMYVSAHHHGSCFTSVIVFSSFRCMSVHTITVLVSLVLLCFLLSDVCQCTPSRFLFHQCYYVFFFPMYVSAHHHGSCFTSVIMFSSFRCMSVHTITVLVSLVLLCFLLSDVCQYTPSRFLFHQCYYVFFFPMYVSAHHHGSGFTSVTEFSSFRCMSVHTITVLVSLVFWCFLLSDVCQCTPSQFLFHQCHCVCFCPMYVSTHHHGSCFTSVIVFSSFRCMSVHTITVLVSLVFWCFLLSDVCQCTPSRFWFHQCYCVFFFPMYVSAHHHGSCFTSVLVFSSFRCMSVHTITVLVSLVSLCLLLSDVCQCTPSRFLFHQCYCVFFFPMYVRAHHHGSCFTSVLVFSSFRCMSVHTITVLVSLVSLCLLLSDVCQYTPSRFLFHQCYCVFFFPMYVSAHHHGSCFTSVIVFSSFRCMSVHTITVLVSLVLLCILLSDVCQCTPSRFLLHQCYCVFFFPMYVSAHHHGSCFTGVIVYSSFRCMSGQTITVLVYTGVSVCLFDH